MRNESDLKRTLVRIDGRGYRAYRDITGSYACGDYDLFIDHVQADPFAAPSRLRVGLGPSEAGLPRELFSNPTRRVAL